MKNLIVAPVGDNNDALFVGIREFPTEKVVLLASEKYSEKAKSLKRSLDRFKIPVEITRIAGDTWEETFRAVATIKSSHRNEILINIATGDSMTRCAAISAAFVNGLKAFDVIGKDVMMLPVLKFSYYRLIPEKKMEILELLVKDRECCASFEELSKKLNMSLPLVSYHINGNRKSEGLKQMGLVEITEMRGRMSVTLTTLGKLIAKGYAK